MKIRITPPDGTPWEQELDPGTTTVGRGDECTITLEERTVSRSHAEFYEDETGTLMLRDSGSRYGTRLNGRLVQDPSPFYHGDVLDIGGFVIEIPGGTVDLGPATGEMETRRLKKDTKGGHPAVTLPASDGPGPGTQRILSWLWVVLLLAGLILLGILLVDYLSGSDASDGDAMLRPTAPMAPASRAPTAPVPLDDASWPFSATRS